MYLYCAALHVQRMLLSLMQISRLVKNDGISTTTIHYFNTLANTLNTKRQVMKKLFDTYIYLYNLLFAEILFL
jgi:hypothetical protein